MNFSRVACYRGCSLQGPGTRYSSFTTVGPQVLPSPYTASNMFWFSDTLIYAKDAHNGTTGKWNHDSSARQRTQARPYETDVCRSLWVLPAPRREEVSLVRHTCNLVLLKYLFVLFFLFLFDVRCSSVTWEPGHFSLTAPPPPSQSNCRTGSAQRPRPSSSPTVRRTTAVHCSA